VVSGDLVAADGAALEVESDGQRWLVSWHPPPMPPDGTPHGAEGICVTTGGQIVLVSSDGTHWGFPAGRPARDETWEQTLRREILEEACATVVSARLIGFTRGACVDGHEAGRILVRSVWRAQVDLGPWRPQLEITHRRVVDAADVATEIGLATHPFAPFIRRSLREATSA